MKTKNIKLKKILLIIFVGFLLIQPFFLYANTLCWDECSFYDQRQDSGNQYRICGDYDLDYCLEWSEWQTTEPVQPQLCWDECSYSGQREESGNQYRICGDYDLDYCLEWSEWQTTEPVQPQLCWDECSFNGQKKCLNPNQYQICGNYDFDYCFEWSAAQTCGAGTTCQNESGECVIKCASHAYKACFNNNVYWYNSCSKIEEKFQECNNSNCFDGKCIFSPTVITKGVIITY